MSGTNSAGLDRAGLRGAARRSGFATQAALAYIGIRFILQKRGFEFMSFMLASHQPRDRPFLA